MTIPGLGLIITGPLAAGLAGAGGITGGLIGALAGSGIPEDKAKVYESGVNKDGHIVLGVHPRNDDVTAFLENDCKTNQAKDICR